MANPDDHTLAAQMAHATGVELIATRARLSDAGAAVSQIKDTGDSSAHSTLLAMLAEYFPDDAVLSEEASAAERGDTRRLSAPRVWIIDPVDGTREYGEGRSDWAVHVALVEAGVPTAAAVALPGLDLVLSTGNPPLTPSRADVPRIVVSRTRPAAEAEALAGALGAELIPMGSAGAKAMAVVRGEADIYVHSGGQYEWDSAAPVGVAASAGLWCSRVDGSDLRYNNADPYLPDLLICHQEDARMVLDVLN